MKKTFMYQNELPSLPIPPLSQTKSKLLEWIEPLLSEQKFKKTSATIEHFFSETGDANKLQKKLHEWDESRTGSWLTPFWDDMYLKHRDSLPLTMNFNALTTIVDNKEQAPKTVFAKAGKISYLLAELYHQIVDETLEPTLFRGKPLDMIQYKKLFRSARIPQHEKDQFYVAEFAEENNYVVMLYKNNVYKVPVTNDAGQLYSHEDISNAINKTLSQAEDGRNVCLFTVAERDVAASVYDKLCESQINENTLKVIANSLAIISIDEQSKNSEEAIRNLMLNPTNKYFDKTIQIAITETEEIGFNIEHTAVDGTSIETVISHVNQGVSKDLSQSPAVNEEVVIEKMKWELTAEIEEMLSEIENTHKKKEKNHYFVAKIFKDFGAEQIKQMKISPNAFFHMALQLAQYRTYGTFKSVYEPVSVRSFYEGRTECARGTSMEKCHLVEAIENGESDSGVLYSLMQTASDAHADRIKDCLAGQGVERHLYGLEQIYHLYGEELHIKQLPKLFKDEGYLTLRHDFLSTSGMAYENAKYRMFAPVIQDGHGIAYFLLDDMMSINISSFKHNELKGKQLMDHLVNVLNELKLIAKKIS